MISRVEAFRRELLRLEPGARDAWVDRYLGIHELPDDSPDLPRGCVPYIPCAVDALLRLIEKAPVESSDVLVDVGSGLGRAASFVHLFTGAEVIGVEIQPELVEAARDIAARLDLRRVSYVEGDAAAVCDVFARGSVFFFYCPFGGERLVKVLGELEAIARTRSVRVCCLDLPLPPCPWLTLDAPSAGDLAIYRSG